MRANARDKLKRRVLLAVIVCLFTLLCLLVADVGLRFALFPQRWRESATDLLRINSNSYFDQLVKNPPHLCVPIDTQTPDPSYVYRLKGDPCGFHVNRAGFRSGLEMPLERDPRYFTVMVLGASVADELTMSTLEPGSSSSTLERAFNEKWVGPEGRLIRVINGSIGGWKTPNQAYVLLRYADGIDAVITLDGANELVFLKRAEPIDAPPVLQWALLHRQLPWRLQLLTDSSYWMSRISQGTLLDWSMVYHGVLYMLSQATLRELDAFFSERGGFNELSEPYLFPSEWDEERRVKYNLDRYARHVGDIHKIAESSGLKSAHFIQPIAELRLHRSDREQGYPPLGNGALYRQLAEKAIARTSSYLTVSLIDLFDGEDSSVTVFRDPVHFTTTDDGVSLGNSRVAQVIVERTANAWGLKAKAH